MLFVAPVGWCTNLTDEGDESCSAYEDAEAEGGDDAMDDQSDNHSHPDDAFPEDSPGTGTNNVDAEFSKKMADIF